MGPLEPICVERCVETGYQRCAVPRPRASTVIFWTIQRSIVSIATLLSVTGTHGAYVSRWSVFHNANGTLRVLVRMGAGVHSEIRDGQSPRFLIRQPVSRHPMLTPQILPGLDRIDRDGCADGRSCVDAAATSEEVLTCLQLLPTYFQRFLAEYDSAEPFILEHENSSIPNNITHNNIEAM